MQYVVMDLEWNNTYSKKMKCFINEIIEIGAVKLDSELNEVDIFRMFVKAQLGKKLHDRVKELTHISNEDLIMGQPFTQVMAAFRKWVGEDETAVLTWGSTDIIVLIDNFKCFNGFDRIPFLHYYADMQKYCQDMMKLPQSNQIGLSAAAEKLNVSEDGLDLHRALSDSILSADCFRKVFNKHEFEKYLFKCDNEFYERLTFKPYVINDINSPLVDKKQMRCKCAKCGRQTRRLTEWEYKNQSFRAVFKCSKCDLKFRLCVKFKQLYDRVDVKKHIITLENETKAENSAETVEETEAAFNIR